VRAALRLETTHGERAMMMADVGEEDGGHHTTTSTADAGDRGDGGSSGEMDEQRRGSSDSDATATDVELTEDPLASGRIEGLFHCLLASLVS